MNGLRSVLIPMLLMELGLVALYVASQGAREDLATYRWVAVSLLLHAMLCVWLYRAVRGAGAPRPEAPMSRPGHGVSSRLLAEIAHEIRNPLNLINNLSEVNAELAGELAFALRERPGAALAEVQDLIEDLLRNARIVQRHGERADRIIRSVMAHARGGCGVVHPVDVNGLVEESVRLTWLGERARCPELEATVVQELGPEVGQAELSPDEVGRVLQNLLQNALDAVMAKQRQGPEAWSPTVTVRTRREAGDVVLQVEDNGPGIPLEVRARIFEPFFTTKPPGAGNTGLGLALSHDIIVQRHGGSLSVESEPGLGTCFTVRLPTRPAPAARE